jgi:Tfp pilus assembly protein PilF
LGRYGEAAELLTEVIRQAPNAADPYCTMGMIHEDQGDIKKALAFFTIAAHLTRKVGRGQVRVLGYANTVSNIP